MEIPDSKEQIKVWSRVRQSQLPVTEGLQAMAAAAMTAAAMYSSLAKQLQGTQRELALQLREQQIAVVRCLKGVYRMASGETMQISCGAAELQTMEAALRKLYGQSLRALHAFETRSADGEYGAVFEALAMREREYLRKNAELMGLLQV